MASPGISSCPPGWGARPCPPAARHCSTWGPPAPRVSQRCCCTRSRSNPARQRCSAAHYGNPLSDFCLLSDPAPWGILALLGLDAAPGSATQFRAKADSNIPLQPFSIEKEPGAQWGPCQDARVLADLASQDRAHPSQPRSLQRHRRAPESGPWEDARRPPASQQAQRGLPATRAGGRSARSAARLHTAGRCFLQYHVG